MKKILLLLLVAGLLLVCNTYALSGAQIKASILRYEPTPAEQGNTIDIWIQLENAGTAADQVGIKFIPAYPFSIPQEENVRIDVGTLAATESKVVKYTLFVDPSAPNGERNVTFWYKFGTNNDWIKLETPLTLQTQDAGLIIDKYEITPSPVIPGQIVSVKLEVRNAGRIGIKNVNVAMNLQEGKFSTIGSGTKKRIEYLAPSQTKEVEFQLASDTSTEVKVYNIPISLNYEDERNKKFNDSGQISVVVNADPELSLVVDSTKFDTKTSPGTISLKVVNRGVVNLKYVNVRLLKGEYELLGSSSEAYVGNIDSDDFSTIEFIIRPFKENPTLHVQLDFKDPYNVNFSKVYDLPLTIITAKDLGKSSFPIIPIVVVLLVGGLALYWWKKR